MVQRFVPSADMVVANRDRVEVRLTYGELGLVAFMVGEVDGDRRLMTRLPSAESGDSVHIFEGVAENDPLRFDDLAIHAPLPFLVPLGRAHAEAPTAADPEIHFADRAGEAV